MTNEERKIQSCIDHINSAIDVDPWAKELAEKALTQMIPIKTEWEECGAFTFRTCGKCGTPTSHILLTNGKTIESNYCTFCGRKMDWDD